MKYNRAKTLVILTPGFPADENDSTCVPPRQIFVRALKQLHPELNIIVLALQYPFFSKTYQWHGVQVISFGGLNKGRVHNLFATFRVWATLLRLNKTYCIIGSLSFWLGKCSWLGSKFAAKHHFKHYSWILGQDAKPGNKYVARIKPQGASLIALSDFIRREFTKNYGILPRQLVPVGIDTSLFSPSAAERDIDILGAGSLIPLKQYDVFLEIIALLKPDFPNIKATICGDGAQMGHLKHLIKELGITANVTLTGRLSNKEVLAHMQRAKIFLHTANYEGFGTVCLEALYAGTKVVSFVKPMDVAIKNWHIATDKAQMLQLLKEMMQETNLVHEPVLPYSANDIAEMVFKLYC
ncbi:glycosyltransferase [Mucilaginibacter calamicampi]|uniref:Glycosyltransferase n=1 Tax=Mucilaginibacter calamicampi TaxID=1302352 RepID=A0ABW2YVV6_9SPHI